MSSVETLRHDLKVILELCVQSHGPVRPKETDNRVRFMCRSEERDNHWCFICLSEVSKCGQGNITYPTISVA